MQDTTLEAFKWMIDHVYWKEVEMADKTPEQAMTRLAT